MMKKEEKDPYLLKKTLKSNWHDKKMRQAVKELQNLQQQKLKHMVLKGKKIIM